MRLTTRGLYADLDSVSVVTNVANGPDAAILRFLYFDRCGSFATDPFRASTDQCPLCTVSDQKGCVAANGRGRLPIAPGHGRRRMVGDRITGPFNRISVHPP